MKIKSFILSAFICTGIFISSISCEQGGQPGSSGQTDTGIPVDPEVPAGSIKVTIAGDINLGHFVEEAILDESRGNGDFNFPFRFVAEYLAASDLAFGNLESVISDKGTNTKTFLETVGYGVSLRADPRAVEGLKYAGFDILNLANNHAGDYGFEALEDSFQRLVSAGISYVGAGKDYSEAHSAVIREIRGTKIAFLGYSNTPMYADVTGTSPTSKWIARGPENDTQQRSGIAWAHDTRFEKYGDFSGMENDIRQAKNQADIVIVSLHFGWEYDLQPDTGPADNKAQQRLARAAIDAGASLVVGHHPHVVQWLTDDSAIENYNGGYIAYSIGNFVFDISSTHPDAPNGEAAHGLLLDVYISDKKIFKINQVRTVYYDDLWQVHIDNN